MFTPAPVFLTVVVGTASHLLQQGSGDIIGGYGHEPGTGEVAQCFVGVTEGVLEVFQFGGEPVASH